MVLECYHFVRCFMEPIAAGPLQVYISVLPYLPPEFRLRTLSNEFVELLPLDLKSDNPTGEASWDSNNAAH